MNVITYQSSRDRINLTPPQIAMLERAGVWPRDGAGEEYCAVSHGLHRGLPTYSDAELANEVGVALIADDNE